MIFHRDHCTWSDKHKDSSRGDIWDVVYYLPRRFQGTLAEGVWKKVRTSCVVPLYLYSWKPGWVFYIFLVFPGLYF